MSPRALLDAVRRWLRSRQGRLILVGAVTATMVTGVAAAQEPTATAPAPTAPAPTAPAPTATVPAVAEQPMAHPAATHPPAEQAGAAAHGAATPAPHGAATAPHGAPAAHGAPAGHAEGGHGEAAVHHPEKFNFADVSRFQHEKEQAARGEKDAHGNPVVPVTPYAYLLINAAILFFIYYRAGKKPVTEGLQSRHDTVAKELAEASKIKAEAEARAKEYDEKLAQLETELQRIKADIVKAGEGDRARIVKEAEEKAERMKKDAQFLLDQELKQLRNDMLAFTAEAAVAAAEAVLATKVTAADHDRLSAEYLDEVAGKKKPATPGGLS
ncbi:MAG: ATP synthase F0 subunit B [Deltaproteobacteria bacterium]|nr:ATP synthase F0 subunit B [Deltaproteobacteria bacterium]